MLVVYFRDIDPQADHIVKMFDLGKIQDGGDFFVVDQSRNGEERRCIFGILGTFSFDLETDRLFCSLSCELQLDLERKSLGFTPVFFGGGKFFQIEPGPADRILFLTAFVVNGHVDCHRFAVLHNGAFRRIPALCSCDIGKICGRQGDAPCGSKGNKCTEHFHFSTPFSICRLCSDHELIFHFC